MAIPGGTNGVAAQASLQAVPNGKMLSSGAGTAGTGSMAADIDIIDIRASAVELNLKEEILKSLRPENGLKRLPTLLLYDERGLQLFEEVDPGVPYHWKIC